MIASGEFIANDMSQLSNHNYIINNINIQDIKGAHKRVESVNTYITNKSKHNPSDINLFR